MKNLLFLFLVLLITQTTVTAQSENCVYKGKFLIDAYYGFPYFIGKYVNEVSKSNTNTQNATILNLNHLGGKLEYMVNDVIGLGLEYTYASVTSDYSDTRVVFTNGIGQYESVNFNASIVKQRILGKINIHFATTKHLDSYATGGLGYKNSVASSNDPYAQKDVQDINDVLNVVPVAFRMGIGLRYFFIKNVGISAETGIGGPIVQGGITIKF